MAQVLGPLPPTWDTQRECLVPDLGMTQPWLFNGATQHLESDPVQPATASVSVPLKQKVKENQNQKIKFNIFTFILLYLLLKISSSFQLTSLMFRGILYKSFYWESIKFLSFSFSNIIFHANALLVQRKQSCRSQI